MCPNAHCLLGSLMQQMLIMDEEDEEWGVPPRGNSVLCARCKSMSSIYIHTDPFSTNEAVDNNSVASVKVCENRQKSKLPNMLGKRPPPRYTYHVNLRTTLCQTLLKSSLLTLLTNVDVGFRHTRRPWPWATEQNVNQAEKKMTQRNTMKSRRDKGRERNTVKPQCQKPPQQMFCRCTRLNYNRI